MKAARVDFLRKLIATPSPSGFEQRIQQVIREELEHYSDEIRTDVHGNVIAALNPQAETRVMLTAHCDEIGLMVRYIDDQGFIYFATIGGFDPSTLPGERVHIHTEAGTVLGVIGRKPIHLLAGEDRAKAPNLSEMWIDIGAASREEALKLAPVGSCITRAAQLEPLRDQLVVSRALDDKAGIFAVTEAMRRIHAKREALKVGVFFAAAVQEEVGSRGATTSAYSIHPQIALAVDVTYTSDHPHTSKQEIGEVKLNGGPVITIGGHINPRVYQGLIAAATEAGLSYQIDPQASKTYTDADMIQVAHGGVATGLVSIPCRYLHTGSEITSLQDIDEVAELLAHFVLALEKQPDMIP